MEIAARGTSSFPAGNGLPDGAIHEAAGNLHGAVDRMASSADARTSVDVARAAR